MQQHLCTCHLRRGADASQLIDSYKEPTCAGGGGCGVFWPYRSSRLVPPDRQRRLPAGRAPGPCTRAVHCTKSLCRLAAGKLHSVSTTGRRRLLAASGVESSGRERERERVGTDRPTDGRVEYNGLRCVQLSYRLCSRSVGPSVRPLSGPLTPVAETSPLCCAVVRRRPSSSRSRIVFQLTNAERNVHVRHAASLLVR